MSMCSQYPALVVRDGLGHHPVPERDTEAVKQPGKQRRSASMHADDDRNPCR